MVAAEKYSNWDDKTMRNVKLLMPLVITVLLAFTIAYSAPDLTRQDLDEKVVTLSIDDGRVVDILKLLGAQHGLNLSISSDLQGSITISLDEVALSDALDVLTSAVNASWYITGNVIVVKPVDQVGIREMRARLFKLQHITASEAKTVVDPLLPDGSKVEIVTRLLAARENAAGWDEMLQVVTLPMVMERVAEMLNDIDKPRPLVEIETRIIETTLRHDSKLGFDFPDQVSAKLGDIDNENLDVIGFGSYPLEGGNWTWGRMTLEEVNAMLDMLLESGNSELISNPRVTTASNSEAEIEVSTTIPVQTLNRFSEGGVIQDIVSFQDLDVAIRMTVTPRVADDSTITLDVNTMVEEITGYTGPPDNRRPITSRRSVNTSVTVRSGESLGLGGLLKEVKHESVKKLPILGQIPILGRVFQHHTVSTEKADLLILITPRVIGIDG